MRHWIIHLATERTPDESLNIIYHVLPLLLRVQSGVNAPDHFSSCFFSYGPPILLDHRGIRAATRPQWRWWRQRRQQRHRTQAIFCRNDAGRRPRTNPKIAHALTKPLICNKKKTRQEPTELRLKPRVSQDNVVANSRANRITRKPTAPCLIGFDLRRKGDR